MFGIDMNEETFAEMQRTLPGFSGEVLNPKSKDEFHSILQKVLPGFDPQENNARSYTDEDLFRLLDSQDITLDEIKLVIFALTFGSYDCKIDLTFAERMCKELLSVTQTYKPTSQCNISSVDYNVWVNEMAICYTLLGTVYSYQKEYIKAAYYFIRALKTEMIRLNMPYCDFIDYILKKLDDMPKEQRIEAGCGFDKEDPMGPVEGMTLNAWRSKKLIADMEGLDEEVIVAKQGRTHFYGHLVRLGSTQNTRKQMIDIYETYLIDKNFKLYTIKFFLNGYFANEQLQLIKMASGFKLKEDSHHGVYYAV